MNRPTPDWAEEIRQYMSQGPVGQPDPNAPKGSDMNPHKNGLVRQLVVDNRHMVRVERYLDRLRVVVGLNFWKGNVHPEYQEIVHTPRSGQPASVHGLLRYGRRIALGATEGAKND